jgi:hypothetical protein
MRYRKREHEEAGAGGMSDCQAGPSDARRRAVRAERAVRSKVPLLRRTGLDAWADWFVEQDHSFAKAWAEFFQGPEQRAAGLASNPEAVAALTELAPSAREYFLARQAQVLDAAVAAVGRVAGLPFLGLMLFLQRFEPWGSGQDPSEVPNDLDFELACQAVAGGPPPEGTPFNPIDVIDALGLFAEVRLLAHAVNTVERFVPGWDDAVDVSDVVVRNDLLARRLVRRGAAYPVHARRLAVELGAAHQAAMVDRLGFDVADFVAVAEGLTALWRDAVPTAVDKALAAAKHAATAAGPISEESAGSVAFILAAQIWIVPAVAPSLAELRDRLPEPTRDRLDAVLAATALRPGEAKPLKGVLDEPAARDRPFLLFDSPSASWPDGRRLLATGPGALLSDMIPTVESLLSRTFGNGWPPARARAVDAFVVDLLASRLPGCRTFKSVYIEPPDGSGRFEMDGLVLFDDMALFVEGKGAPFKLAARRGSVDRYRGQVRDLLGYGAKQLARDSRLLDGQPVPLLDARGTAVGLLDPALIRRSFQVLPSLDDLGDAGTAVSLLGAWGVLGPGQTPWIVAVTDMAVVVDALRGPAELVAYLEWRMRWLREPRLLIVDEMEMFVLFQRAVDLHGKLRDAGGDSRLIFESGQPAFDDYYSGLDRTGPASPQPRVRLTRRFHRFADELTRVRPNGWLGAASAALQAPESVQLACDDRLSERSLTLAAAREGAVVTGDREFATVVVDPHIPWPDAYREHRLAERYALSEIVLMFRATGARLRLEWACRGSETEPPPRWKA